jgi:hypothetical protein
MRISQQKPPIYDKCVEHFGVDWEDGVIFTYGDTIYCKYDLSENKIVHESTHIKQQDDDPDEWWNKYFNDPEFRLQQELEAYKNESVWINKNIKDRNYKTLLITENARALSSKMYGNIISFSEAYRLLK